jgi:hypothetical protein
MRNKGKQRNISKDALQNSFIFSLNLSEKFLEKKDLERHGGNGDLYNLSMQECIFMCFLHDKLIPAVSMAFIFMCITTENEMNPCEKKMSFLGKQLY